jgi:uncharacterized protein (TIGR02145 family)
MLLLFAACKKNTPPEALFTVSPASGTTETEFAFDAGGSADAETPGDMLSFRWDWDYDGRWDTDFSMVQTIKHIFTLPGSYSVNMQAKDEEGLLDEFFLVVEVADANERPVAAFTLTPETGTIETVFSFDASPSSDKETPPGELLVRWDWDNSGAFTQFVAAKTATHQYALPGTYHAVLEVKDGGGHTGTVMKDIVVTGKGNTVPNATFTVSPAQGDSTTLFSFDASGCSDEETPKDQLQVRWDYTNDGNWDTGYTTAKGTTFQFLHPGTYTVRLEVKDGEMAISGTTRVLAVNRILPVSTFADQRDGHVYKYVTIGTQVWMAENLAWLPAVSPSDTGSISDNYYYVYGYEAADVAAARATANFKLYGVLYNWPAACAACPAGWHLPTDDEWKVMEKFLGMSEADAEGTGLRETGGVVGKIKEAGTTHWGSPNSATNSSGFTALPGGARDVTGGNFAYAGSAAGFWTSTARGNAGWFRGLGISIYSSAVYRDFWSKADGFSVRCVKD